MSTDEAPLTLSLIEMFMFFKVWSRSTWIEVFGSRGTTGKSYACCTTSSGVALERNECAGPPKKKYVHIKQVRSVKDDSVC